MLKRRVRPKMNVRTEPQIRCPGHLAWVRGHECAAKSIVCSHKIEAAHVRTGTDGGTGLKPGDNWTIPLCSEHHFRQHMLGEGTFSALHGFDMKTIAKELWAKSPHRVKWESKRK